jgi:hypothetical protein
LLRIFRVPDGGNFRNAALTGLLLSAGLLSKGYFLALIIPSLLTVFLAHGLAGKRRLENLAVAATVCGILAGPWYVRNWMLYGNWSGMIEATRGTGMRKAIANVADVPWASSIWTMLHSFVWTGNNSFLSFSQRTIELYLFVIACGLSAYAWYFYRERAMRREWPFLLCGAMFTAAILYSTALSYVFTRGESTGASPWYGTPLVLSAILLAFGGFARSGRAGQVGMAGLTCLSSYIALATFWLKLLPLYGGLYGEKTDLRTLAAWYGSALMGDVLSHTLLAPLSLTLTIIAVASVLIVLSAAFLVQRIIQSGGT